MFKKILDTVIPSNCRNCGEALWGDSTPFFCDPCWSTLESIKDPTCQRCGLPFQSQSVPFHHPTHRCANCRLRPPAFTLARTGYRYISPLKEAVCLFKYQGKVSLARPLATLLLRAWPSWRMPGGEFDIVLPVPLHPARLQERQYNQSHLLAFPLSRELGLPLSCTSLVRVRQTIPQTSLKRTDRLKNLRRSFAVTQARALRGKRVLLIDDVFTTGTTVNECAKTLRKAGASHVYVVTLARMV